MLYQTINKRTGDVEAGHEAVADAIDWARRYAAATGAQYRVVRPEETVYETPVERYADVRPVAGSDGRGLEVHGEAPPPELDFCSRCRDHADFERGAGGEWRSACCDAPALAGGL